MNATTTITVTVPTERLSDLYGYVATLFATTSPPEGSSEDATVPSADLTYDDVKDAYLGGTNNQPWKDLLLELSLHPGEEVFWPDLCEAVGYNRKVMSGVIGAGERRTKDKRPYSKRYAGDDTYFLMSAEVAKMIHQVATMEKESPPDIEE
jgi:hypothetical protein